MDLRQESITYAQDMNKAWRYSKPLQNLLWEVIFLYNNINIIKITNINIIYIIIGDVLTKINYDIEGTKDHFYKLVPEENGIRVFDKKDSKSSKLLKFSDYNKITYGISTDNLSKRYSKLKSSKFKNQAQFLSLVSKKKSVDLYLDEHRIKTWFYGLSYIIETKKLPVQIMTRFSFIIAKVKLQLIDKIKTIFDSDVKNPNKTLLIFTQLQNFAKSNEFGLNSLPFIKIFLLYLKISNINI